METPMSEQDRMGLGATWGQDHRIMQGTRALATRGSHTFPLPIRVANMDNVQKGEIGFFFALMKIHFFFWLKESFLSQENKYCNISQKII